MTQQTDRQTTPITTGGGPPAKSFRPGDRVRVRSRAEILTTLDERGTVDGMPFMPEMLGFEARTFVVDAVVHRTCDTVGAAKGTGTNRALTGTVHLRGTRCDGAAHGGCQARCLLYWNENWLEAVPDQDPALPEGTATEAFGGPATVVPDVLAAGVEKPDTLPAEPVYVCQATELVRASCFVSQRSPRLWVKDIRSGNTTPPRALASFALMGFNRWQSVSLRFPPGLRIRGGQRWPWCFPTGERRRFPGLGLVPGDMVEVKPLAEIESTLDEQRRLRGLWFSPEMVPFCGTRARVLAKVDRIVDEKSGRMLKLRDCFILESVWCDGNYHALCRRKLYSYWREAWLRPVDQPGPTA